MNVIENILKRVGPTSSSKIVDILVSSHGLTKSAARKRISRGTLNTSSLKGITLPRREKFIYLKSDYGSPQYWDNLIDLLQESNSAYGLALGALIQRGSIVLKAHFPIICGSPLKQAKHLTPDTVLKNLVSTKLVSIINVSALGECVALSKGNDFYYEELIPHFRARMITENILLGGVSSWVKNIGLASYEKVLIRKNSDEDQPKVGTFNWDLTAPSYVGALTTLLPSPKENKSNLGFIACDICLDSKITVKGLAPFLYKCNTLRSLKNVGKCLQLFIADRFTKEAFIKAKQNGVLPVTTETLFGKEVSEGLNYLLAALNGLTDLMFDPEMFDEMFVRLSKIEGAVSNLRGAFFEFIVAEVFRKQAVDVRMNYMLKTSTGQRAESDVVVYNQNQLLFVECKGYSPHAVIPDSEVEKWLTERVPKTVKAAREHTDWKNITPTLEFWTTGKLSDNSIKMIERAMSTIKPTKYKLGYKDAQEVQRSVKETGDESLIKSFEKNFIKDPVSSIKLHKPQFGNKAQFDNVNLFEETPF
jgi:hypothetical protein